MPLLDHFRPPVYPRHRWDSFHAAWASRIADMLNDRWLPANFLAEESTFGGQRAEIDIASYEVDDFDAPELSNGTATATRTYSPPRPAHVVTTAFPEQNEVRIYDVEGVRTLVAAIELISPANKDRPSSRRQFAAKCVGYLASGVSVVIIDIVTKRKANLHNLIAKMFNLPGECVLPDGVHLYAASYRPVERRAENMQPKSSDELELWFGDVTLGQSLPTMPMRLKGDLFVPVEFDETYAETCRRRRVT